MSTSCWWLWPTVSTVSIKLYVRVARIVSTHNMQDKLTVHTRGVCADGDELA